MRFKLNEKLLNEKYGDIPKWLSNRLNAIKPFSIEKGKGINPKFSSNQYGDESDPTYRKKWNKEHPGINSLYDQLDRFGLDLSRMSAKETYPPATKAEIRRIENTGKFPAYLLKDPNTNKTQVYIVGINDDELAMWLVRRELKKVSASDLLDKCVAFAILDIPMKDAETQRKRQEWGDESSGISGKQRNKDFIGVQTSDGSMDFDKSGYNTGPAKKRLRSRAAELRLEKEKLKGELTDISNSIPEVENDINNLQTDIEEKIPSGKEIANQKIEELKNSLRSLEYRIKNCVFELDDYTDEEIYNIFNEERTGINTLAKEFFNVKKDINQFDLEIIDIDKEIETGELESSDVYSWDDVNVEELFNTGALENKNTGEFIRSINYYPGMIESNIRDINNILFNISLQDLDWD